MNDGISLNTLVDELVDRIAAFIPSSNRKNAALALKALNRSLKNPQELARMMVRERTWIAALKCCSRHGTTELAQAILRYMSAYGASMDDDTMLQMSGIASRRRTPEMLRFLMGQHGYPDAPSATSTGRGVQVEMARAGLTAELQAIHAREDTEISDSHHHALLESAVGGGRCDTVQWLLTLQMPLDVDVEHLLTVACRKRSVACAKLLLPLCHNPERALCKACGAGLSDLVSDMLGLANPPRGDCFKGDALVNAARHGQLECMRLLLDSDNPPRADSNDSMALYMAIETRQSVQVLSMLLNSAHPPTRSCKQGFLSLAVRTCQMDTVRILLASVDPPTCTHEIVQTAAESGNVHLLEYLCAIMAYDNARKVGIAKRNHLLVDAAQAGRMSIVRWALALNWAGLGDDIPALFGTAMCSAARAGHCDVALELLLRAQPPPRGDHAEGSALAHACKHGHLALVHALLDSAHPPRGDCMRGVAMINAASSSCPEVARALLDSTHPPRADLSNGIVLLGAALTGNAEMVGLLLQSAHPPRADCVDGQALVNAASSMTIDAARVLLSSRYPPRGDSHNGAALTNAARNGNMPMARLLWASQHPPLAEAAGGPALVAAASENRLEMVLALLLSARPPRADFRDGAALISAASRGHVEVATALLQSAHPPRVDSNMWQALCDAHRMNHIEMVALLMQHTDPVLRGMRADVPIELHNTPIGTPRYAQLGQMLQAAYARVMRL
jgi:ankyrin repeat protein